MASPRRMTRARAKKEGYVPDWRIDPHWRTPRKPKKTVRTDIHESSGKGGGSSSRDNPLSAAQKVLPPSKPARPPQPQLGPLPQETTESLADPAAIESLRKSALGSPVRVRPRQHSTLKNIVDKENSASISLVGSLGASEKTTSPSTPKVVARPKPLEESPTNINTKPSFKVLSTPLRVAAPQTPSHPFGSPRRIPIKVEKLKSPERRLVSLGESPTLGNAVNQRSNSPAKALPRVKMVTSPAKPVNSPIKSKHTNATKNRSPQKDAIDVLQLKDIDPKTIEQGPTCTSKTSKNLVLLKPVHLEHHPPQIPNAPVSRPVKQSTPENKPKSTAKTDVLCGPSTPTPTPNESKSPVSIPGRRSPIHRRSVSDSSPFSQPMTPKTRTVSNPSQFDSLQELKPVIKVEGWKTPRKGAIHPPSQSVQKVLSPDSNKGVPTDSKNRKKSLSILALETPEPLGKPDVSGTPDISPLSKDIAKVFNLFGADGHACDLFSPCKSRSPDLPNSSVPEDEPSAATFRVTTTKRISLTPSSELMAGERALKQLNSTPQPAHEVPKIVLPKGQNRSSNHFNHHRDIRIPIRDPETCNPQVAEPCKASHSKSNSDGPLAGVTAFIDVRTADGDDAGGPFAETLKSLGARVVKQWAWNGEDVENVGITHVIFKQGGPRTLSKVKMAKGAVKCIGLGWVSRCEIDNKWVDESLFKVELPAGQYGHKRRKSMEPKALPPASNPLLKERKDQEVLDIERTQRALSQLSLNKDLNSLMHTESVSLQLARRHKADLPSTLNLPSSPLLPLVLSESPSKRPPSSSASDSETRKRQKNNANRLRSTRLISYAMTSRVGSFESQSTRATAALDYTKVLDTQLELMVRKFKFGTQHLSLLNPKSMIIEILLSGKLTNFDGPESKDKSLWHTDVSLMLFFHHCGYKPRWHPDIRQMEPTFENFAFKTQGQCVAESRDMLAAVGIDHKDLQFLVGKKNLYQEFQSYVHDLRVPVVAAALSQICRRPSCSSSREAAYKKIWLWLTGYHEFKDAVGDTRYMGTASITCDEDWEEEDMEASDFWTKVERIDWN